MKRPFAALAALLALALAFLIGANGLLGASGAQLSASAAVLTGDRSAASGVRVELTPIFDRHLYWDLAYSPGIGELEAATGFSFDRIHPPSDRRGTFETHIAVGWGAVLDGGPNAVLNHLASLAGPGGEVSATLDLSDFYEFYPVAAMYYSAITSLDEEGLLSLDAALGDFFRIPVPEGDTLDLHVTFGEAADGAYDIYTVSSSVTEGTRSLSLQGLRVGEAGAGAADFLAFYSGTRPAPFAGFDFSHIPGGFGIYRLPWDFETGGYAVDGLECVLPLDAGTTEDIVLCPTEDGAYLMAAVLDSGGAWTLYLLDAASGETVQTLPLFASGGGYLYAEVCDGFVVFSRTTADSRAVRSLLAARYSTGRLETVLQVDRGQRPELGEDIFLYDTAYALEDGRLVMADLLLDESAWPVRGSGLGIAVYSAAGLEYFEHVELGLPVIESEYNLSVSLS